MDEIKTLTYLDWVVRETLRVHAPVPNAARVATQDDLIPMEDGSTIRYVAHLLLDVQVLILYVRVAKGDSIFIPILALNRAKDIWGEDAFEFK